MDEDGYSCIPGRVEAAMQYIHWSAQVIGRGCEFTTFQPPDLSITEQKCHQAALDVLLSYFRGEMDYGDAPPKAADKGDDEPKQKVEA